MPAPPNPTAGRAVSDSSRSNSRSSAFAAGASGAAGCTRASSWPAGSFPRRRARWSRRASSRCPGRRRAIASRRQVLGAARPRRAVSRMQLRDLGVLRARRGARPAGARRGLGGDRRLGRGRRVRDRLSRAVRAADRAARRLQPAGLRAPAQARAGRRRGLRGPAAAARRARRLRRLARRAARRPLTRARRPLPTRSRRPPGAACAAGRSRAPARPRRARRGRSCQR